MTKSLIITASIMLCWMFSPDALVLTGNLAGKGGWLFIVAMVFALAVYNRVIAVNERAGNKQSNITALYRSDKHESVLLNRFNLPGLLAATLTIAAWLCLVLFIPTGTLVTAGFSFNETFAYWFPNFGFSFLLLGIILAVHLHSKKAAFFFQKLCFSITIAGLLILVIKGFSNIISDSVSLHQAAVKEDFNILNELKEFMIIFASSLLLFIGFNQTIESEITWGKRFMVLSAGVSMICFWAILSGFHISDVKLADSTIPYILAAKSIAGQTGRIIMGIVVIFGSAGMVNGLMIMAYQNIMQTGLITRHIGSQSSVKGKRLFAVLVAGIVGILMASGLAGEDILETYIFGSLLLWLLLTIMQIMESIYKRQSSNNNQNTRFPVDGIVMISLPGFFIYLLTSYSDFMHLIVFLSAAVSASMCTGVCWALINKKKFESSTHINKGEQS